MGTVWDQNFARIVATLQSLQSVWSRAKDDGVDTSAIEERIGEIVGQMSEEQLEAYGEYAKERLSQADRDIRRDKEIVAYAEAVRARRKSK